MQVLEETCSTTQRVVLLERWLLVEGISRNYVSTAWPFVAPHVGDRRRVAKERFPNRGCTVALAEGGDHNSRRHSTYSPFAAIGNGIVVEVSSSPFLLDAEPFGKDCVVSGDEH